MFVLLSRSVTYEAAHINKAEVVLLKGFISAETII